LTFSQLTCAALKPVGTTQGGETH